MLAVLAGLGLALYAGLANPGFVAPGQCLTGTCSISIDPSPQGPLTHVGVGFLDGFDTDAGIRITAEDAHLVEALHPRQWRLGQASLDAPNGGVFSVARDAGARVSLDLTSDWEDWAWRYNRADYVAPYDDLSTYSSFIYGDVKRRIAAGQVPDYFDVWNEPSATATVDQWLSVYGTAYRAIKAADPSAQVVGPSISSFLLRSGQHLDTAGYQLSLTDFLNWEMRSHDRFAAITWHEDGTPMSLSPASPGTGIPSLLFPAAVATIPRQRRSQGTSVEPERSSPVPGAQRNADLCQRIRPHLRGEHSRAHGRRLRCFGERWSEPGDDHVRHR